MTTPSKATSPSPHLPSALETATYAVTLLEDNPLFNSGHVSVFTRDGINELEASVMVSRGFAKRGVGVTGLRRVRNPILLARAILEHGDADLSAMRRTDGPYLDVPSAQGHSLIHGRTAEILAERYQLPLVEPEYFFTQTRWDEHLRALEDERNGKALDATWSCDSYLPQGTVGAVALDADGIVCAATSTGGMTNKLTGRIGDTPMVGAGFWAEEWIDGRGFARDMWPDRTRRGHGPIVMLSESLKGLMADCLPTPFMYNPVPPGDGDASPLITTRSIAVSGTGNGDSFIRVAAARTASAIARYSGVSSTNAVHRVAGPGGELQKSAGNRWGITGEGQGGMIAIGCTVVRDREGNAIEARGEIIEDFNSGGMFRAWIDEDGRAVARVFRDDVPVSDC